MNNLSINSDLLASSSTSQSSSSPQSTPPPSPEQQIDIGKYSFSDISVTDIALGNILKDIKYTPDIVMDQYAKNELILNLKNMLPQLNDPSNNFKLEINKAKKVSYNSTQSYGEEELSIRNIILLMKKIVFNYNLNKDNDASNENENKKQLFKDSLKMAALCGNGDTYCKMSLYEYNDVLYTKPIDIEKANATQNSNQNANQNEDTFFEFLDFLKNKNHLCHLILEIDNMQIANSLFDFLYDYPDFIRYINSIVCTDLSTISSIQKLLQKTCDKLMLSGKSNLWIYLYNISYYWKVTYDIFPYLTNDLQTSLEKVKLKENFYNVNNNIYSPGVNCGLFIEYNQDFGKLSGEEQKKLILKMKKDMETCTKKEPLLALWNDSSKEKDSKMDFDNIANFKNFYELFMNMDFINTEV